MRISEILSRLLEKLQSEYLGGVPVLPMSLASLFFILPEGLGDSTLVQFRTEEDS